MQAEVTRGDLPAELIARLEQVVVDLERELGFEPPPGLRVRVELLLDGARFDRAFAHLGPIRRSSGGGGGK